MLMRACVRMGMNATPMDTDYAIFAAPARRRFAFFEFADFLSSFFSSLFSSLAIDWPLLSLLSSHLFTFSPAACQRRCYAAEWLLI